MRAGQKRGDAGFGTRLAKVARQRHESGSCFTIGGGSRSVCFVFQPNKEGQVGRPLFLFNICFLSVGGSVKEPRGGSAVWNVSSEEVLLLVYMVTHAPGAYFRSSTDTTWLFVSCRKVFPSHTLSNLFPHTGQWISKLKQ